VNGKEVGDYNELRDELEKYDIGSTVTLTILRDDDYMPVEVVLEAIN
jgi:S1-C subfamily serine protease